MAKKRIQIACAWIFLFVLSIFPSGYTSVYAAAPSLSTDEQWITGLSADMEYITEQA